jgi:energy-coupling factor transporter ATP-binding protein EcfA2
MNTKNPHIISEGGREYHLGELKGDHIHYNFQKILIYLEVKGKILFGDKFKIYSEDEVILFKLVIYTIQDADYAKRLDLNLQKGIILTGPVGCGKTSLMKLLRHIVPHKKSYKIIPCRNAVFSFNHLGYKTIEDYGNSNFYCFDDLGVEPTGRHYGQDCNVIGEILLSRYDLFLKNKIKTHCTTNLNAKELEERYGNRVRSRMRQLFNLVAFDKESVDKRC